MSDNEIEQGDCGFSDFESQLFKQTSLQNVEVVDLQKVMQILKKTIENVKEKCNEEQDRAIEILQYYDWRDDQVDQNYFKNQEELLQELKAKGILNDHSQIAYQTKALEACPVRLEENYLIQLGCLHKFCESCIEQTIQQKVKEEHSLIIRCLSYGCLYRIPFSMIEKYCRPEDLSNELCKKFIENFPKLAYCTGVDCKKILYIHNLSESNVICSCSNEFCFRCKMNIHPPAPCDLAKKWIQYLTKDEVNIKWIALNTKVCPFCKKSVERASGCNFMHCKPPGGCGKSFCYNCGNPWEPDHKDHFRCNKYVAPKNNQEIEKEFLARYNFYSERFQNSELNYKKVYNQLKEFRSSIIFKILDIYQVTVNDCQLIEESLQELLFSRRVLKWTYCYNFFVEQSDSTSKQELRYYQDQFELALKQLDISLSNLFEEVEICTNQHNKNQKSLVIRKTDFQQRIIKMKELFAKTTTMRLFLEKAMKNGEIGL